MTESPDPAPCPPGLGCVPRPLPPSYPTARSRAVRVCVLVAGGLLWAGAMAALWRSHRASALVGEGRELAIFTEAFEQNLRMRMTLKVLGYKFRGEAERRTKEPYEGRLIVRAKWRLQGTFMDSPVVVERDGEARWDRGAGGFRSMTERVRLAVPGLVDEAFRLKASRSRDPRTGDKLLVRLEIPGGEVVSPNAMRLPAGVDLSSSFMEAARVRPPYVGARWKVVRVNPLSGEIEPAEAEVVEEGIVPFIGLEARRRGEAGGRPGDAAGGRSTAPGDTGRVKWGYRTVVRVEKETGATVEQSETWYDEGGHALMQTLRCKGAEIVLERIERLAASDTEWETMAIGSAEPAADTAGE